ncbi:hypothetical protein DPEC_G00027470 [Dallia pectoralis]|uniref:Uncharacterized protein n=1 Tax=Dallia pectoralis TaxID=75939 RepID=A0ACC2HHR8_DALPE|nr:hypothetical protein DPEC_G00027470 [Dallia pectoralis]
MRLAGPAPGKEVSVAQKMVTLSSSWNSDTSSSRRRRSTAGPLSPLMVPQWGPSIRNGTYVSPCPHRNRKTDFRKARGSRREDKDEALSTRWAIRMEIKVFSD